MTLQVLEFEHGISSLWDDFVTQSGKGTFFHLSGWKQVLEGVFGHRTYFCYAQDEGKIVGVLPLAHIRSRLFGNTLSSLPFCVYGGVVAETQAAEKALREKACNLARTLQVDALELRHINPSEDSWPVKNLYATFRKSIVADQDANLQAIPSKQRTMIRKGIRNELTGELDPGFERIFDVYSESVRNLGTPVFSKNYFKVLRDVFGGQCDVLMVTHQGRDVAGVLSFYFKDQVLPYYGGSIAEARTIKGVNDFMYWDLMCRAAERGCRLFDFGRSKVDSGPYNFKRNWGFEPEPLHYEYFLVKARAVPEINPNNPKYRKFIQAWKKLPLPVANTIGPFLARSLG